MEVSNKMIDIHAHFDREKDKAGTVLIHARANVPDLCIDIELIVAHIVKGLATQLPENPAACYQAALMFSIAAAEGAKRGLREFREEAHL